MKLYQKIARTLQAMETCNDELQVRHINTINMIEGEYFPHGSGIDADCYIDLDRSTKDKIWIVFDYHLMNDHGYYDGWLLLDLIVKPDLSWGFDFKIKYYSNGNDKSKVQKYKPLIEDYLEDLWNETLNQEFREF